MHQLPSKTLIDLSHPRGSTRTVSWVAVLDGDDRKGPLHAVARRGLAPRRLELDAARTAQARKTVQVRPLGQVEEAFREWQELGSKCVVVEVEGQGVHGCPADRCDDHRRPNGSIRSRLVSQKQASHTSHNAPE